MTNFDFLTKYKQFNTFSKVPVAAEIIIHIDPALVLQIAVSLKEINFFPIELQYKFAEFVRKLKNKCRSARIT